MMRGTKPQPTALKLLKGNPGKRPISPDEPTPTVVEETAAPPDYLSDEAKKEWLRVAPILVRNGLLTEMDLDALGTYCAAFATWREATEKLRQFGMVVKSPTGYPIPSPYLPIANQATKQMRAIMADFGMNPSARTRVRRARDPHAPANPLQKFLDRKR